MSSNREEKQSPRDPPKQEREHEHETARRDRGRRAERPTDVPKSGWRDILWRTRQQLAEDNLSIVAAGVAFYGFVAVVPALAAVIAIYGLVADPADIQGHLGEMARFLPAEVLPLLQEQLTRIATNETAAGWGAVIGFAVALVSSAKGAKAMISGLNIAYDEREKRRFVRLNLVALTLTFLGVTAVITLVGLVAVLPAMLQLFGVAAESEDLITWLRWPLIVGLFTGGLAVLYRVGPSRNAPQWKWLSWGAATATLLWLVGSALFSLYVSNFGSYNKTYGSLGTVVVFLLWLHLTCFVILLGAELNSEMERQTRKDTTKGPPAPLGQRGAYAADTVGPSRPPPRERKRVIEKSRR